MRQFTRHSTDIPLDLELQLNQPKAVSDCQMTSISQGGLSCDIEFKVEPGCKVQVNIPSVLPPYTGSGEVSWCKSKGKQFEIGVQFFEPDEVSTSRMVQQVCQIEHYKNVVFDREGELLDGKQAAEQWIEKHAGQTT